MTPAVLFAIALSLAVLSMWAHTVAENNFWSWVGDVFIAVHVIAFWGALVSCVLGVWCWALG